MFSPLRIENTIFLGKVEHEIPKQQKDKFLYNYYLKKDGNKLEEKFIDFKRTEKERRYIANGHVQEYLHNNSELSTYIENLITCKFLELYVFDGIVKFEKAKKSSLYTKAKNYITNFTKDTSKFAVESRKFFLTNVQFLLY